MNYVADGLVLLGLLAFAGRGVARGLVMSIAKLTALAGGMVGAHLGAAYFKGVVASKLILPWMSEHMVQGSDAAGNPIEEILSGLSAAGAISEQELLKYMEATGIPKFSLSAAWGSLIDRLTGTGTNIFETARTLVAERISYVLIFIIIFLTVQLTVLIVFTSIDGLKNLPLVGFANKLGGGAAGLITGGLALWGVMGALILFVPSAVRAGGLLSPEVMEHTKVAAKLYHFVNSVLRGI